jgi:hypothetical protein
MHGQTNIKVNFLVHYIPLPFSFRSQLTTLYAPPSYVLKILFTMIFHLRICLTSCLSPSGSPTNIYMHLSSAHSCNMTRPSHSSWFDQLLSKGATDFPILLLDSTPRQFSPYFLRIQFTISTSFLSSKNDLPSSPHFLTFHSSDDTGKSTQSRCLSA